MREIVDGGPEHREELRQTALGPKMGEFGRWMLSALELPDADTRKMLRWMWFCKPRASYSAWRVAREKPWEKDD